jgi:hypothetical protein
MDFVTIERSIFSIINDQEGNITQHRGIGITLACEAKHFHMLKEACILFKYKSQGLQKIFVMFYHHFR